MVERPCTPRTAAIALVAVALAVLTAAGAVLAAPPRAVGPSPTDAARGAALTHVGIFAGVNESERARLGRR